jgi:hypothetical protein
MCVILNIFMLVGLLLVGFRHARGYARRVAERAAVSALRQGCNQFEQQMAFFPPLVKDYGDPPGAANALPYWMPPGTSKNRYRVYNPANATDLDYLRGYYAGQPGYADRFSIYTIPYYLLGTCEVPIVAGGAPIDGVAGPGTRTPRRDGSFELAGRTIEPLFDAAKGGVKVVTLEQGPERVQLQDAHGVAFRFYHWEHGAPSNRPNPGQTLSAADLNVPALVGDPTEDSSLRDAQDAIVAAGPNGVFGDELDLPPYHPQWMDAATMASRLNMSASDVPRMIQAAKADNIVEVLHGK